MTTSLEILQDPFYDITMFWIYESDEQYRRQKRLVGVNFHQGIDEVNMDFAKPKELLTHIYVTRFKGNLNAYKEDILKESITEYLEVMTKELSGK